MKTIYYLFVLSLTFCLASCETDSGCGQADWIGVYTLDSSSVDAGCEGFYAQEIVISAGSSGTSLIIENEEYNVSGCTIGETVFDVGLQYNLTGTSLQVNRVACSAFYSK